MGALSKFDLKGWIEDYNLVNYVETGFGDLTSFKHALRYNFQNFYGVDLDKDWCDQAKALISNATFIQDYSTEFLLHWTKEISGNTLWYLDSHFVSSDYKNLPYDESIKRYERQSLPLEDEIVIIKRLRDISKDVIVIDDFFLYSGDDATDWTKNNPFQHRELVKSLGIELNKEVIYNLLQDTHSLEEVKIDQSYLVCTPKII